MFDYNHDYIFYILLQFFKITLLFYYSNNLFAPLYGVRYFYLIIYAQLYGLN